MGRRRWPFRYECNHPGCTETAHHEFRSLADLKRQLSWVPKDKWFCVRHAQADEVLSNANRLRVCEMTCLISDAGGKFWGIDRPTSGFVYGPGFKAFAKDFRPGTRVRVTAELIMPESDDA